jgi:uncharacterized membrane protein (Fun14 family)
MTGGLTAFWSALAGWKRYLLGISGAMGIAGMVAHESPQNADPESGTVPVEEQQVDTVARESSLRARPVETSEGDGFFSGKAPWKDSVMRSYASRIGISFFVALLVGTLLRLFLRGMLTVMVLAAVAVAALVHYEVIEPFWTADSGFYRESAGWVKDQTQTLKDLFVDHAPSGFAAAAGLFLGLRK